MPSIRLEWNSVPYEFNFGKRNMRLDIQSNRPQMEINYTTPQLQIDETLPREEAGFRTMLSFARFLATQAQGDVQGAIEDTAAAGDRMAKIELPENGIIALAEDELFKEPPQSEGVSVPQNFPEIRAELTPMTINVTPGSIGFDFSPAVFDYRFEYGKISMSIVAAGGNIDAKA